MIFLLSVVTIFFTSLFLAVYGLKKEWSVPEEVKKIKINKKRRGLSGVILFLKEKIVHYTSYE